MLSRLTRLASGAVIWNYTYNSKHLLESESLSLDSKTFNMIWGYNSLGQTTSLTYPTGRLVSFNTNALGQARQAGVYANGASYYPNGQINQFTFGNGITRQYILDEQLRPKQVRDYHSNTTFFNLHYHYDANHNITHITDTLAPLYNLSLNYDGVNRLVTANGQWGAGSFSYDELGNSAAANVGPVKLEIGDSANLLGVQFDENGMTNTSGQNNISGGMSRDMGNTTLSDFTVGAGVDISAEAKATRSTTVNIPETIEKIKEFF